VSDLKQLSEDQYDRAVKQLQAKKQKQVKWRSTTSSKALRRGLISD
jgi:hypothetical protein